MSRVFFTKELEGVATWWRIERKDGVTLGFTSHDRDLAFGGLTYRAAPGILPSAIRKTSGFDGDGAEMQGPLAHDSISAADLAAGRFDDARVSIGAIDWETLERTQVFAGSIGTVSEEGDGFSADLLSAKEQLAVDNIPRTSPTCRAVFCGPGCALSSPRYTLEAVLDSFDVTTQGVTFPGISVDDYLFGYVRWIDGPHIGQTMDVVAADSGQLILDTPLSGILEPGMRAILRQGCDHTLATCQNRFANAANFRGEPFLPGNDLLTRYPSSQ